MFAPASLVEHLSIKTLANVRLPAPLGRNDQGISPACVTCYLSYDMLGSVRMVTDQSENLIARHDYVPFGEEIPNGSAGRVGNFGYPSDVTQGFTGQESDGGTAQLDFFSARHLAAVTGAFVQPDPGNAGADVMNPQSWNGYGYVLGNPLDLTDPSGLGWITVNVPDCTTLAVSFSLITDNSTVAGGSFGRSTTCVVAPVPIYIPDPLTPTGGGGSSGGSSGTTSPGSGPVLPSQQQQYQKMLLAGFNAALNMLRSRSCASYYGGQGQSALQGTSYRFYNLENVNTGAQTNSPTSVFINSAGPYVNYKQQGSLPGPFGVEWLTPARFQGFILLHELGHQLAPVTGFQPDAKNSALNQAQSMQVINACIY